MRPHGTYLLPVIHPAALQRRQTMEFATAWDWKKAARIQREGATIVPPPLMEWQTHPTLESVMQWFDLHRGWPVAIDFEATQDRQVVCMSAWSTRNPTEERGICVPFLSQGGGKYWTNPDEEYAVLEIIQEWLADPRIPKVGHNLVGYDTGYPGHAELSLVHEAWGVTTQGIIGDTIVAMHSCFPELPLSLAFLSSLVTDLGPYKLALHGKGDGDDDPKPAWTRILERPDLELREYALRDAFATAEGWNVLREEMAP
jgi:hypothetical protein